MSIAFDKKRKKKFGMRLKIVVTLHRQSDRTTILRPKNRFLDIRTKEQKYVLLPKDQKKKEINKIKSNNLKIKERKKLWQRLQFQ